MLARLSESLPSDMGWVYELKYDGHRTLGFVEGGHARLITRNQKDCTARFFPAAEALERMLGTRSAVVDGEMTVADGKGLSDFSALQAYRGDGAGLVYVLFDLLALDGQDLRGLPLTRRKAALKELTQGAPPCIAYSGHTEKCPTARELGALKARGAEGIVAKRADSPYTAGKNGDWRKLKLRNAREFVIGGYTVGESGLKALLVGAYDGKPLLFAGSVGTGFQEAVRRTLAQKLSALRAAACPFAEVPKRYRTSAVWVRPVLAAQVTYAGLTASGLLRQASFQGLREDKDVSSIENEAPMSATEPYKTKKGSVRLTSAEKVMFPASGLTKGELFAYYEAAAARMLPYVKGRPMSVVCCPAGVEGEKFFRRHLQGEFSGIGQASLGEGEAFFVKSARGILSLVQYNAVELHVQGAKCGAGADVMVFDLDPDEGLPLAEVRRGASDVKELLASLGLRAFLKTSGGKGYHVCVPLRANKNIEKFSAFAKTVAEVLEREYPRRYTASISKRAREGKIFIDWQRNVRGATSAAPYSVRARAGATVSMPIAWEELGRVAPDGVTVAAATERLRGPDPWADFFDVMRAQTIKE